MHWRRVARRLVRSQAQAIADHGNTITVDNWQGRNSANSTVPQAAALEVLAARQLGHRSQRSVSARRRIVSTISACSVRWIRPHEPLQATLGMHTGSFTFARPSIGSPGSATAWGPRTRICLRSWRSLRPLPMPERRPGAAIFCPAATRERTLFPATMPIANIDRRAAPARACSRCELDLLGASSTAGIATNGQADLALEARIKSFETAFGMQREAPRSSTCAGDRRDAGALWAAARADYRALAGSAWLPGGWPSAACGSSS